MNKVTIAFDIDGTLRCNCTATCQDVNRRTLDLLFILQSMKNTKIIIWSGGGADYARRFMNKFDLKHISYASKLDPIHVDIAIDDQQDFGLGTFNLIVKEK